MPDSFITPNWPTPQNVKATMTTRSGGFSKAPYESLNLGDHVGDDPQAVKKNRQFIKEQLSLPSEPCWLSQIHGNHAAYFDHPAQGIEADAAWTDKKEVVLAVMTADCLPILLTNQAGNKIAVIHGGWRSLAAGIIENTLTQIHEKGDQWIAWLGAAIGSEKFEVGPEVRESFIAIDPELNNAFVPRKLSRVSLSEAQCTINEAHCTAKQIRQIEKEDKYLCDIFRIATHLLQSHHEVKVYSSQLCTMSDPARFFSYRRDGETGRMVSLIYLTA